MQAVSVLAPKPTVVEFVCTFFASLLGIPLRFFRDFSISAARPAQTFPLSVSQLILLALQTSDPQALLPNSINHAQ